MDHVDVRHQGRKNGIFSIVLVAVNLLATAGPTWALDDTAALVSNELAGALAPFVERIDRPLVTFRYENDASFAPDSATDAMRRLAERPSRVDDPTFKDANMVGPGTYVAVDPFATRHYGKKTPNLFILTLRTGTPVLNGTRKFAPPTSSRVRAMLNGLGCRPLGHESGEVLGRLRNDDNPTCRTVAIEVTQRLGIQAILYTYYASGLIAGCERYRRYALNVIRWSAVDPDQFAYASDTVARGSSTLLAGTRRLLGETMHDPFVSEEERGDVREFGPAEISDSLYDHWKKDVIYGCGAPRTSELQLESALAYRTKIEHAYRDVDLFQLQQRAKEAFFKKSSAAGAMPDFRLADLRWVQDLTFDASGARAAGVTAEDWRTALRLVSLVSLDRVGSDHRLVEVVARLRETVPRLSSPDGSAVSDPRTTFMRMGAGPLLATLLANKLIFQSKGVPLLSEGTDPGRVRRQSRDVLRTVLETCLSEYQRPEVSFEQIQGGRCAMGAM